MSLTNTEELLIRKELANKIANVTDAGYAVPSPLYFNDSADFWANLNALTGKTAIETTPIALTVISFLRFQDTFESNSDEPLKTDLFYNFYHFRQYSYERSDQTQTPDDFLKTTLSSYNLFVKTIFDLRGEFMGEQPISVGVDYEVNSNSLTQTDFTRDSEFCRFIPSIEGHSIDLICRVTVKEPC